MFESRRRPLVGSPPACIRYGAANFFWTRRLARYHLTRLAESRGGIKRFAAVEHHLRIAFVYGLPRVEVDLGVLRSSRPASSSRLLYPAKGSFRRAPRDVGYRCIEMRRFAQGKRVVALIVRPHGANSTRRGPRRDSAPFQSLEFALSDAPSFHDAVRPTDKASSVTPLTGGRRRVRLRPEGAAVRVE